MLELTSDVTGLMTATVLNTKISGVEKKIQNYCCS